MVPLLFLSPRHPDPARYSPALDWILALLGALLAFLLVPGSPD